MECNICNENKDENSFVKCKCCSESICSECANNWYKSKGSYSCPLCRKENYFDIETVKIPFIKKTFIDSVFFCNQKIHDEIKSKNQFIKHKALLYECIYKDKKQRNKNLNETEFNIITYSENDKD